MLFKHAILKKTTHPNKSMPQLELNAGFQILHLDDVFSDDGVEKNILKILENRSRIFNDNLRFLNYGNRFMHTLNERAIKKYFFCIFSSSAKAHKRWVTQLLCASHFTIRPQCQFIERFITIQNVTTSLRDLRPHGDNLRPH